MPLAELLLVLVVLLLRERPALEPRLAGGRPLIKNATRSPFPLSAMNPGTRADARARSFLWPHRLKTEF